MSTSIAEDESDNLTLEAHELFFLQLLTAYLILGNYGDCEKLCNEYFNLNGRVF